MVIYVTMMHKKNKECFLTYCIGKKMRTWHMMTWRHSFILHSMWCGRINTELKSFCQLHQVSCISRLIRFGDWSAGQNIHELRSNILPKGKRRGWFSPPNAILLRISSVLKPFLHFRCSLYIPAASPTSFWRPLKNLIRRLSPTSSMADYLISIAMIHLEIEAPVRYWNMKRS